MRIQLGSLRTAVLTGALVIGLGAAAGAQYAPPASQQPMEIPTQAQFPPPGQGSQPPQYQGQPQAQEQQSDPGAARMSFIRGDVSTQHDGSSEWTAATLNTPVVNGDHISTGQNARAEIQLDHANILRLSERSTANIVSLARNQMQLQVGQGLANYEVFKNNDASVEIQTPNVAIRPESGEGSYRILVNSDGETIIDVRKGSAEISTPQGSTRVERDQRITIQGNTDSAQYQVSGAPGRDDWDRWNSDRDHTIEGADSWKHTNPNYTGSQDLDAYGHWSNVPDYGDVWFPSADSGWAPYRDGRWVYEPYYGWTWVSYEPWGWAPYHYGRWFVYGGNWGWWPGPVYAGYYPVWAPAYVSFFGFGGGGWGVNVGFGFGGYGNVGWLPCGPGDRFFPWYGRGVNRVNVVNVYNIHNNEYRGGMNPLRQGPHAYSNVDRAFSDDHVRSGFSSMKSDDFGRGRVPQRQSRIDAGSFRKASMMTGANPVSPSRESYRASDRQPNPSSIPNRGVTNQRFFNGNARTNGSFQGNNGGGNSNRGGNFGNNAGPQNAGRPGPSNSAGFEQSNTGRVNRGPESSQNPGQRGYTQAPAQQQSQPIQSSRPGWRTFTPPSGQQGQSNGNGGRGFGNQNGGRGPANNSQPSESPRPYQNQGNPNQGNSNRGNSDNPRGNNGGYGSNRPTLSMQQPVVTPRGNGSNNNRPPNSSNYGGYPGEGSRGGSYSGRPSQGAPNGGNYNGNPGYNRPPSGGGYSGYPSEAPRGGSYSGRPAPSAPSGGNGGGGNYSRGNPGGGSYGGGNRGGNSGGNYGGGGSHGGYSGGGSHGGNSGGGGGSHGGNSGGHNNH